MVRFSSSCFGFILLTTTSSHISVTVVRGRGGDFEIRVGQRVVAIVKFSECECVEELFCFNTNSSST